MKYYENCFVMSAISINCTYKIITCVSYYFAIKTSSQNKTRKFLDDSYTRILKRLVLFYVVVDRNVYRKI